MSKQNLVIIIVIVISLVIGGLFGFYFYLSHKSGGPLGGTTVLGNGFFGFGTKTPTPAASAPSDTSTTTAVVTVTIPKPIPVLRQLTSAPVAGSAFIIKQLYSTTTVLTGTSTKDVLKPAGFEEVIRWLDRATGNIYETSSSTLETTRISNTTIPKIDEAYFVDSSGNGIILRDLIGDTDVIRTRYGNLQPASTTSDEGGLKLTDLTTNITQLAVSPTKDQIFNILTGANRGVISKTDGSSQTNVFNSPFHEWLVSWPTAQTIVLNTKPSGTTDGFAYTLNTKTGAFLKLIGNKTGLTTLMSPDGLNVLVGESPLGTIQLDILNLKTGNNRSLFIRTFPEKCVWSKLESTTVFCAVPEDAQYDTYPDAWYMGRVAFSDDIWKIDTTTGRTQMLVQPPSVVGQALDMENLSLSQNEDFLLFQNKSDLSLWSYQLKTQSPTATTTATSSVSI